MSEHILRNMSILSYQVPKVSMYDIVYGQYLVNVCIFWKKKCDIVGNMSRCIPDINSAQHKQHKTISCNNIT